MPRRGRTIVVGAGHNALAAAYYLARAGRRPLVLERQDAVGGGASSSRLAPGFSCPTFSHEEQLHRRIVTDMNLPAVGASWIPCDVDTCALDPEGPALVLYADAARPPAGVSTHDAASWSEFARATRQAASVLQSLLDAPAPDATGSSLRDLWRLGGLYRKTRGLQRADAYRLLQWLPMPIADMVDDWFECALLRAAVAARGLLGTSHGPRAAGSTLVWLTRVAHQLSAQPAAAQVRGGPGALTGAMARAAHAAGAEIRLDQDVERIAVEGGRVTGVVVAGHQIEADCVVSGVDPKTTLMTLVGAAQLPSEFAAQIGHYRANGTLAKLNLALSALPAFAGVGDASQLTGRIHIGPTLDYLERASDATKYGEWSSEPWMEIALPSVLDPSLAPAGAHVASIYVQSAPRQLKGSSWPAERERMLATCLELLDGYAPGLSSLVVAAELLTPEDIELRQGTWGGHGFHGDLALDQWFAMRPAYGLAQSETPVKGLYLCGAGTHPGGFLTGTSGRLAAERVLRAGSYLPI
jgi:phytoene dehydrogenase-like protein